MKRRSLVGNVADAEQVEGAQRIKKNDRDQHLDNLRAVLASEEGRSVLWLYVNMYFGVLPGPGSVESLNFNEGQRALAGRMAQDIGEAAPEALNAMLQKHFSALQERSTTRS